jgi:membrane protein DedA with SNARE-associated domain
MLGLTIVERIVQWVEPAFTAAGYFIIAGAVIMERSVFIGLIVPGDLILALGGVYSSQGRLNLVAVILIGIAAAIIGETAGFWLGRRYGRRFVARLPVVGNWLADRLEASQEYFKRHGGLAVALGRYATAAGAFVPFTAGGGQMPYPRFIAWDAPAIAVWATGISLFGYFFGKNLPFVDRVLSRFGYIMLAALVLFFAGRYAYKRLRKR